MYTYVYICRCRCIRICISRPPQTPGSPDRTPASAYGDTPNESQTHTGSSRVTWARPGKYVQAWVSWLVLLWLLRKKSRSGFCWKLYVHHTRWMWPDFEDLDQRLTTKHCPPRSPHRKRGIKCRNWELMTWKSVFETHPLTYTTCRENSDTCNTGLVTLALVQDWFGTQKKLKGILQSWGVACGIGWS